MRKLEDVSEISICDIASRVQSIEGSNLLYHDDDVMCMILEATDFVNLEKMVSNNMSMLVFCISGSLKLKLLNSTIRLGSRDALFIRPKALFLNVEVSDDFKGYWLGLNMHFTRGLMRIDSAVQQIVYYLIKNNTVQLNDYEGRIIEAYFKLIETKIGHMQFYGKETISSIIKALLYDFFSHVRAEFVAKQLPVEPLHSADSIFLRFTEMLLDRNSTSRKVSYYADQLCITSKYLSYVCCSVCGKTAMTLINEAMTESIKYYLEHTTLSVKEISILLDFPSLSFFGRYVKKHLGKSPNAYRADISK
ncbi:MAG: helix-turn-helix domain-containing protein [Muribaculaceae bacterium]